MYKVKQQSGGTKLEVNRTEEGEFLHTKIERMIANKEDITEGVSQLIYTERKEGVRAEPPTPAAPIVTGTCVSGAPSNPAGNNRSE